MPGLNQGQQQATDLNQIVKGVPIHCIVRMKAPSGFQREDVEIVGNRVRLKDLNGNLRDEVSVQEAYTPEAPTSTIFNQSLLPHARAAISGVNTSFFLYGSTSSGRSKTMEGEGSSPGLVKLMMEALYQQLEQKRYESPNYQFSMRVRFMEILDEEVYDLLQPGGGHAYTKNSVKLHEWEGPHVQGINWIPVDDCKSALEFFSSGLRNKTGRSNEFGRMSEKASQLFQAELTQHEYNAANGAEHVVQVSKISVLKLPSCEVLQEDPETLRIKQGNTLNKGSLAMNNLMRDLAATAQGDYANYDESVLTNLTRDIFGGNSLTVGIFCLQHGDPIGSGQTMRAQQRCQNIMNFPIQNESSVLGLLRKYRVQIQKQDQLLAAYSGHQGFHPKEENLKKRVADLQTKLIEQNMSTLKAGDDKDKLVQRMADMKSKFNELVESKAQLQQELIYAEEEKLKVSKALIELQIENTGLNEQLQNKTYETNTQLMHAQGDLLEINLKEEKATKAIAELQDLLTQARNDRKDLEIEFITLKKNYYQIQTLQKQEKQKNENLGIELINLVNENKALQKDLSGNQKTVDEHMQDRQFMVAKNQRMDGELEEYKNKFLQAQNEINELKAQVRQLDLFNQKNDVDLGNKKMELERQFLEQSQNQMLELEHLRGADEGGQRRFAMERDLWEGEKTDLLRKMRDLNRKIEELQDDIKIVEEQNTHLKSDKARLTSEIEDVRGQYRGVLRQQQGDDQQDKASMRFRAKEELTRSYQEKETQLAAQVQQKERRADEILQRLRALKRYSRQLKFLAEDLNPVGQPLPDILTQQPPVALDDEDDDVALRSQQGEISRLRQRNIELENNLRNIAEQETVKASLNTGYNQTSQVMRSVHGSEKDKNEEIQSLRQEIARLQEQIADQARVSMMNPVQDVGPSSMMRRTNGPTASRQAERESHRQIQEQLQNEINMLKGAQGQSMLSRPGTSSAELAQVRSERDNLLNEVKDLRAANERLLSQMNAMLKDNSNNNAPQSAGPSSGNLKQLQQRLKQYEKMLQDLERERSQLKTRVTMAETQNKALQDHLNQQSQTQARTIANMKDRMRQAGVDTSGL